MTENDIVRCLPIDGLHGRRVIYTDKKEVNRDNVREILGKALVIHGRNEGEINYLWMVYRGKQDIRTKEKIVRPQINNIVTVNRANEIVTFKTSYLLEGPIQYTSRGGKMNVSTNVQKLNDFMTAEDKPSLDKEILDWMAICGVGVRMVQPDEEKEENGSPLAIYTLDPREAFVIYHSGVGHTPLAGVLRQKDAAGEIIYQVYTRTVFYTIKDGEIISEQGRTVPFVPIIEYPANAARLGAFEVVLPQLNAINVLESNRVDSVQDFVNAFDVFQNCEPSSDDYAQLTSGTKAIVIKSIDGTMGEAKVYRISSTLDQTNVQTLVDDLYDSALEICGMPNRNGGSSTSDTGTATIMRDGWQAAESRAKDTETIFDRSERQFLKVCLYICRERAGMDISVADINIEHTRRNLSNMQSRMQVLTEGLNNEKIHPKLPWVFAGMPNAEENYQISMDYYEEQQEKLNRSLEEEMNSDRSVSSGGQGDKAAESEGDSEV